MSQIPHPHFQQVFTDKIYDVSNQSRDDQLPFGTDSGADLLEQAMANTNVLFEDPRLDTVLGQPASVIGLEAQFDVDSAELIVSAAFILLRITGSLFPVDMDILRSALESLERLSPSGSVAQLSRDLTAFASYDFTQEPDSKWLKFGGLPNDPEFGRWLNRLADRIMDSIEWQKWWQGSPTYKRLILVPRPVGPSAGGLQISRSGDVLIITATSKAVVLHYQQFFSTAEWKKSTKIGLHEKGPGAATLLLTLISEMFDAASIELGISRPTPELPVEP